jgi:hypothetical protein
LQALINEKNEDGEEAAKDVTSHGGRKELRAQELQKNMATLTLTYTHTLPLLSSAP